MRLSAVSYSLSLTATLITLVVASLGWATAQSVGPFTNASLDGIYAFVAGWGPVPTAPR